MIFFFFAVFGFVYLMGGMRKYAFGKKVHLGFRKWSEFMSTHLMLCICLAIVLSTVFKTV